MGQRWPLSPSPCFQNPIAIQLSCHPPDVPPPAPVLLLPPRFGRLLNLTEYGLRLNLQSRAGLPARLTERQEQHGDLSAGKISSVSVSLCWKADRRIHQDHNPKPSRERPKGNTGGPSKRGTTTLRNFGKTVCGFSRRSSTNIWSATGFATVRLLLPSMPWGMWLGSSERSSSATSRIPRCSTIRKTGCAKRPRRSRSTKRSGFFSRCSATRAN
jgi:hypothetical protein